LRTNAEWIIKIMELRTESNMRWSVVLKRGLTDEEDMKNNNGNE